MWRRVSCPCGGNTKGGDGCRCDPEFAPTPTMAQICEALAVTYTDDGVAMWLGTPNRDLGGMLPIDVCETAAGRERVFAVARGLRGMVAT
jgi:hypothetical protein